MATEERQKYNFLVALTRQLRDANRDESECANDFLTLVQALLDLDEDGGQQRWTGLDDRIGKCEQWLAALETALESLEQIVGAWDDQDAEEPDDGDDIDDVGAMEPPMGGLERAPRRGALDLGDTGRQPGVERRAVTVTTRRLVGGKRGTE